MSSLFAETGREWVLVPIFLTFGCPFGGAALSRLDDRAVRSRVGVSAFVWSLTSLPICALMFVAARPRDQGGIVLVLAVSLVLAVVLPLLGEAARWADGVIFPPE